MKQSLGAALLLLLATACASDGALLHHVEYCCGPRDARLATFSVALHAMPAFLATPLRAELVAALTARGLRQVDTHPDALVTLTYNAIYLDAGKPLPDDGFGDPVVHGGQREFDARVTLDVRRASDDAELLRGVLSREHKVSVGEYDHAKGRPEIRRGFDALLSRLQAAEIVTTQTPTGVPQPLSGITVLDFGQIYNGPYCGFLLAMAGARVIKVESPQGEVLRARGEGSSASYPFAMLNSNKEAITLNLKSERGRELLRGLVKADVVLENFSPARWIATASAATRCARSIRG